MKNWRREIRAILRKEILSELRSPHAFLTAGFFAILAVASVSIAAYNIHLRPTLAAGLIWVILLFALSGSLPRTFIAEEENGTADLLRLMGHPHAVYWGKWLFNFLQAVVMSLLIALLFLLFGSLHVQLLGLFIASLLAGALALSGAVTLCGALAARASNRQALATAIALPLTMPLATWGVSSMRVALGEGVLAGGNASAIGLAAYGVISVVVGPYVYAALWKS